MTDRDTHTAEAPSNPTRSELKDSLDQAEFPRAAQMAKDVFGEAPQPSSSEEE